VPVNVHALQIAEMSAGWRCARHPHETSHTGQRGRCDECNNDFNDRLPGVQHRGQPVRAPHEYIRTGTAKQMSLFHPASGAVRIKGVRHAPNAVLQP
jgi:hypothetical protein